MAREIVGWGWIVVWTGALTAALLDPSASAEVLYDKEGIQLQGAARIVSRNAATCNILKEKYSAEEYEKLKANQGQPLHVWRLDFSAHNNTGQTLDFLQANFDIRAPQAPCTNWSGEGPGGGPAGDFTDLKGHPGFVHPAGVSFKGLSRVSGMGVGEVARDTMFMLVFHRHKPDFKRWSVHFNRARVRPEDPDVARPSSGPDPPGPAQRPRIQLPPDILADKYLRQAEQMVKERGYEGARKAMEELLALEQEHGLEPEPEDHYRYAQVWSAAGAPERAMESAVRYLQLEGREVEHYEEALDLINRAEAQQGQADEGGSAGAGNPDGSSGIRAGEAVAFDGMEFVWIPPGEFLMGSVHRKVIEDVGLYESNGEFERPVTQVVISEGFYLGKYEVTQDEWQAVMGNKPSSHSGCGRCPVEQVSWEDVQVFIGRLNAGSGRRRYRLPTEAEWEYAARAGTTTDTYAGDLTERTGNLEVLDQVAWYLATFGYSLKARTHPVGQKLPNPWGLYDMLGNVNEWVEGGLGEYPGGVVVDPQGPQSEHRKALRGGGFADWSADCRSASRFSASSDTRLVNLGFRLLREE